MIFLHQLLKYLDDKPRLQDLLNFANRNKEPFFLHKITKYVNQSVGNFYSSWCPRPLFSVLGPLQHLPLHCFPKERIIFFQVLRCRCIWCSGQYFVQQDRLICVLNSVIVNLDCQLDEGCKQLRDTSGYGNFQKELAE